MAFNSRLARFWITVSVASLLAYDLYWLIDGFGNGYRIGFGMVINAFKQLFGIPTGLSTVWIAGHAFPFIGLSIRFVELVLALSLIFLVWGRGGTFSGVKRKLSVTVFLEAIYFLCFSFSVPMLHQIEQDVLAASYFLQIVFTAPLLIFLSVKVWKSQGDFNSISMLKWVVVAYVGYVAAIGVNNILSWVGIAQYFNNQLLPSGNALVGFANSVVCMSVALVFAMAGVILLLKTRNRNSAMKMFGVSLAAIGAHFIGYLVYSYFTGSLGFVMLMEIWAIPLLGLGASLFYEAPYREPLST